MKNLLYYFKYLIPLLIFLSFSKVWGQQTIAHAKKNTLKKTELQINQKPVAQIKQPDKIRFCDSGILNAIAIHPNATYEWILNGARIGVDTTILISESGIYTLQVTFNEHHSKTQIEVFILSTPQQPILEINQTSISIQNVEIDATYRWFRNGKVLKETGSSIPISAQGNYQVIASNIGNTLCRATSENVEINPIELVPITKENEGKTDNICTIYPNPSKEVFNVCFPTLLQEDMNIEVFDVTGKTIKKQIFEKNKRKFLIDIRNLSKGLYLIRFSQNDLMYSKSILME